MRGTLPTWDDSESPVEADGKNVRPRLGHNALVSFDAIEEGRPVGSRNVSRCQGTVIDVDTDDEQPLARFHPLTDVVEGLERDLCGGLDSQLDQSISRFKIGSYPWMFHVDDQSGSHVLACVVGVPGSSVVDCGRVAVAERRHDGPKRLRLPFAGSQTTTVPASRLDAPPHFEVQGWIYAGASARVEDSFSPCGCICR